MKLNVDFIDKEDYLWVYQNCDIFRKYLYDYFDFRGKGLTHWAIKIKANGHYIEVTLHKAPKLNEVNWMILNCTLDNDISTFHKVNGIGTITNTINTTGVRNRFKQSKELNSIKEETQGAYFKDIMKIIKRDIKLKNILEENE
jgi:hypothetical protein